MLEQPFHLLSLMQYRLTVAFNAAFIEESIDFRGILNNRCYFLRLKSGLLLSVCSEFAHFDLVMRILQLIVYHIIVTNLHDHLFSGQDALLI